MVIDFDGKKGMQMETNREGFLFKGSDREVTSQVDRELLEAVERKRKEHPELEYHEAMKLVASERPDLDRAHARLMRGF
jgi:hypothetical protein